MLVVDEVYVAHYAKLKKRKEHLLKQLKKNNIKCQWFEQEPSDHDIVQRHDDTIESWEKKILSVPYREIVPYKKLNYAEKSLAHKHIKIYEDIIKNQNSFSLILEDDVVLCEDFVQKFNFNMYNTPKD